VSAWVLIAAVFAGWLLLHLHGADRTSAMPLRVIRSAHPIHVVPHARRPPASGFQQFLREPKFRRPIAPSPSFADGLHKVSAER
jgi:hypothetical protein